MYSERVVKEVLRLAEAGVGSSEIARITGVHRCTVSSWRSGFTPHFESRFACPCQTGAEFSSPAKAYVYLLGLYIGDGNISLHRRDVYKLRIACASSYPRLIERCETAMSAVMGNQITKIVRTGYTEVACYSKHWPCLFPQHGVGKKHERRITLMSWQQGLVDQNPWALIEGLIHSDGCRVLNWVNGTPYPRYHFSNRSSDIRGIFQRACVSVGVDCCPNNQFNLSVARRASVALMDTHIAAKA